MARRQVGAKILVSGGSRCNVTNRVVTERDFWGGDARAIRDVLRAYPAPRAVAFFEELGVRLHEEEDGKFFPESNRARTVLDALISALSTSGAELHVGCRISGIRQAEGKALRARKHRRSYLSRANCCARHRRPISAKNGERWDGL
jgi:predicted flavoprotein YhiN